MTRGWIGAAAVAVIVNAAMLVPVYRAHHRGARIVDAAVCSDHLMGGYGQTDRIRLALPVQLKAVGALDRAGLMALGFRIDDVALVGDTIVPGRFPPSRPAWVRLVQGTDSAATWQAVAVGTRREDVEGPGLVSRARISIFFGSTERLPRVEPMVRVEPASLYLRDGEAARLRELRVGASRCITSLRLGNGTDGSIWVDSVP